MLRHVLIPWLSNHRAGIFSGRRRQIGNKCAAAAALKQNGAKKVLAYCTHPVLSGKAIEKISASEIDELVVTDTIPLSPEAEGCEKIRQLSIANLFAETIRRISDEDSVSSLFID